MKKYLLIILVLSDLFFMGCVDNAEKTSKNLEELDNEEVLIDTIFLMKKLDSLAKVGHGFFNKFIESKDEFKNLTFYTHKRFGKYWPNRKTLTCGLNSDGYIWLNSNYFSENWLFHTMVTVLIGDEKFSTQNVERYESNNRTQIGNGKIWEVITYENEGQILEKIANSNEKTIKVRFHGKEFYDDIVLSKKDIEAISDSWKFSIIIKSMLEVQNKLKSIQN